MQLFKNKKPLKIRRLTRVVVHLTVPFSNSFYKSLLNIYGLKDLLIEANIADKRGFPFDFTGNNRIIQLPQGH